MKNNTCVIVLAMIISSVVSSSAQTITSGMLGPLRPRSIGPAVMSGRIADIAVVDTAPRRFYVGAAGGGLWKTTTGGASFTPVFDEYTQSIGAISIDQAQPDTVWVGTGESWTRNSVSAGDGVYRTTDAGRSWKRMGLDSTERISQIVIHPKTPSTIYVAAPGPLFHDSPHRGLFRTTDGGTSWTKILSGDQRTGCTDVVVNAKNPNILLASMWSFRRTGWSFTSGGSGSGIFRSTDGGATWKRISAGLPGGELGRIGLAASPVDPQLIYACVEAKESGLYRSTDGGVTWERRYTGSAVDIRPFYFSRIVCDPVNKEVLYKHGIQLYRSDDGGQTFATIAQRAHSDHHAVWINPANTRHLLIGTDGGLYASDDRGATVRFFGNLPISQFYHVRADNQDPFMVYGGLQDNGSWRGPSRKSGGIRNRDWTVVGGGDGFYVVPDQTEPHIVFWESQGGNVVRTNLKTMESKSVAPTPDDGTLKLRYNWNTPIVAGSAPGTIYVGSQYLHRTTDRGETWTRISPDLTTNDPAKLKQDATGGLTLDNSSAENHCTIYTIAQDPKVSDIIWVGTDDGNLQVTPNAGATWKRIVVPDTIAPAGAWVSHVEPSRHQPGTCFVTFDAHTKGDHRTYVAEVSDFGSQWRNLVSSDMRGYAHVVKQDPVSSNILMAGTEHGLYLSLDAGASWITMKNGFPTVAVRDIDIQPSTNAAVIATHGRGLYIIDNLNILREITPASFAQDLTILRSPVALRSLESGEESWFESDAEFSGESIGRDTRVWYILRERHTKGPFAITMKDSSGRVIRTIPATGRKGLNSVDIPIRNQAPLTAASAVGGAFGSLFGPLLAEGTYTLEFTRQGKTVSTTLGVITDTTLGHSLADRQAQQTLMQQLYDLTEELAVTVAQLQQAKDSLSARGGQQSLRDSISSLHASLVNTKEGMITGEEQVRERLASLYGEINSYLGRPSNSHQQLAASLTQRVTDATRTTQELLSGVDNVSLPSHRDVESALRSAKK